MSLDLKIIKKIKVRFQSKMEWKKTMEFKYH